MWASNLAHRSCLQYLLGIGLPIQVLGMTRSHSDKILGISKVRPDSVTAHVSGMTETYIPADTVR